MPGKRYAALIAILLVVLMASCATAPQMNVELQPLVVLMTDFGERDHYVGALKGAVYSANPGARIDTISHEVDKFDFVEGAFTLAEAAQEYPAGTIFVAIVDPGVGSERKGIAVLTENRKIFIGPDNGLLSLAAEEAGIVEVREVVNRQLMRQGQISSTFHGRDIFGPVAGHLAAGVPFEAVGPVVPEIVRLSLPGATRQGSELVGMIIHIDDYGNIITNIPMAMVEDIGIGFGFYARMGIGESRFVARFVRTYSDVAEGDPLFLNNKGYAEIALNRKHLASAVGARRGMEVRISPYHGQMPTVFF